MTQILVGDLAQLYGLSKQTLHYYENKGILQPARDWRTGYRYFKSADIQRLGTIKKYRNAGFSLPEGVRLCEAEHPDTVAAAYRRRHKNLRRQIALMQLTAARMEEELTLYERCLKGPDKVWIERLDGFFRFEVKQSGAEIILQDEATGLEAEPWFSNLFFTSASERYYEMDAGGLSHFTRGILIDPQGAEILGIPVNTPHVQAIPEGMFATWMMAADSLSRIPDTFAQAADTLRRLKRQALGAPFTRTVMACRGSKSHSHVLRQVLIPLAE